MAHRGLKYFQKSSEGARQSLDPDFSLMIGRSCLGLARAYQILQAGEEAKKQLQAAREYLGEQEIREGGAGGFKKDPVAP